MTIQVTSNHRVDPGQTLLVNDLIGVNIQPSGPSTSWNFNNAGTIIVDVNMPYIVVGMNFDFGSFHHGAVFTNEATGVFRVISRNGTNPAFGLAGGHYGSGWNGDLVNAGLFEVSAVGYAAGVFTFDHTFSLINSGSLRVTSANDYAIGAWATNGGTYLNTGQIDVRGVRAYGLVLEKAGTITNSGEIRVTTTGPDLGIGLVVRNFEAEVIRIDSAGLIDAAVAILDQSFLYSPIQNARQVVFNSGVIRGLVDLRHGDDVLENAGLIEGRVNLGAGADFYDGRSGSTTDVVSGGAGADRLWGGAQRDVLVGDDGDDDLQGNGGDDFLAGGRGADRIDGGAGADTALFGDLTLGVQLDLQAGTVVGAGTGTITAVENAVGSDWSDVLRGDAGANSLFGAAGDDTLDGRGGSDLLSGEGGADLLTGGGGADTFVFAAGGGRDVIADFAPGVDRLQVHGYAGWREVRQDGADVLLILSDTDSIRLQGLTVAAFGVGSQVFLSTPAPSLGAPDLGGTVNRSEALTVNTDGSIVAGETLVFRNVSTAVIVGSTYGQGRVRFVSDGFIDLAGSPEAAPLTGVSLGGADSGATFVNGASGRLVVQATNGSAYAAGVSGGSTDARVENHGVIEVSGQNNASGVTHNTWSLTSVTNAGIIRVASGAQALGISAGVWGSVANSGLLDVAGATSARGIVTTTNTPAVLNSGTIRVVSSAGTAVGIDTAFGRLLVNNSGTIEASIAVRSTIWDDRLDNTGSIVGAVSLGSGDDVITNHGRLTGLVSLGDGADLYDGVLSNHAATVDGEGGNDRLLGGNEGDTLRGGAGVDWLDGGKAGDTLDGGDGDDTLVGGDGNDVIYGGEGRDTLDGGRGDDSLIANGGNDVINGGAGHDILIVSGGSEQYRLIQDGDNFLLKGPDGTDRLSGVEAVRFDDGQVWDLARMFETGPEVLPPAQEQGGFTKMAPLPPPLAPPVADDVAAELGSADAPDPAVDWRPQTPFVPVDEAFSISSGSNRSDFQHHDWF